MEEGFLPGRRGGRGGGLRWVGMAGRGRGGRGRRDNVMVELYREEEAKRKELMHAVEENVLRKVEKMGETELFDCKVFFSEFFLFCDFFCRPFLYHPIFPRIWSHFPFF